MKLFQIFNKTPNYRKFNYTPRFYNPEEEDRKNRIREIEREFNSQKEQEEVATNEAAGGYERRIRGSFSKARQANGSAPSGSNSSPMLLRLAILLILTVGLIGYLQYGMPALYGMAAVLIPLFLYLRFRKLGSKG